jgi:type I restriction enzyme S subunit
MKIASVIKNIELILQTPQGIELIRKFFINLAIKGKLDSKSSDDDAYPSNWLVVPANQVFKSRSGNSKLIKGKLFNEPGPNLFPGYSASGQDVWLSDWEHQGVAVILSAVGARCGKAFLATGKWSAIANTHIIWIDEELFLPDFAYLILNNEDFWIRSGSAQPFVKVKSTLEKLVGVPPLEEQKWIVGKIEELLGICDELEAKLNIRNLVGAAARESAVDAISTAQSPEELQLAWERIQGNWEVIAGSRESIESLRELILDILFKPKKVNEWQIKSFADLLSISNGDRSKNYPSKEHRVSTGIPFVNAGHLKDGLIDLTDMDYISREKYESLSGGKFNNGDILFCLRGSLGKSALVKDIGEGTVASSLAIFKVGVEIDTDYLFWFLQSGMARIQIKKFDNGTAQPNLAAKSVLKFQVPLPKLPEQKSIVRQVGELMKLCEQLEQKIIQKEDITHKFARSVVSASA